MALPWGRGPEEWWWAGQKRKREHERNLITQKKAGVDPRSNSMKMGHLKSCVVRDDRQKYGKEFVVL
jgi:hypothetical protein